MELIWTKSLYKKRLLRDSEDIAGAWDIQLPCWPHWAPNSSHSSVKINKYNWAETTSQAWRWAQTYTDE